jgi:hypothetical protein
MGGVIPWSLVPKLPGLLPKSAYFTCQNHCYVWNKLINYW